jgi:pimeloyl-ACP methyl ester carboxylesterase
MQAPETRTLSDPHPNAAYQAARPAHSRWVTVRGWQLHLRCWGDPQLARPERPPLLLMHGWMDVAASFQFLVDALHALEGASRYIVAADWRGFGLSTPASGAAPDSYWFPDYLADLDALCALLLAEAAPGSPGLDRIDLLGHSMGGNVVMSYAGLRPQRLRRLVNLEGFGLPRTRPDEAPGRLLQWLDAVQQPAMLRSYASAAEVAARLRQNNPLLPAAKADWLAPHWARPAADGRWHILADAAHKRPSPLLYQVEEHLALWRQIRTPLLWAEGDQSDLSRWWGQRYPRSEFESRLAVVPQVQRLRLAPCGHMLHHDQPEALAEHLQAFLG